MTQHNPHRQAFRQLGDSEANKANPVATAIFTALANERDPHPLDESAPAITPAPFRTPVADEHRGDDGK